MEDAEDYRAASRRRWERAAAGWAAQRGRLQRSALPVSAWLVEAIHPQPGHRVLELAAGPGDTGLLAAELIAPGGTLLCTDVAEGMLEAARARAAELGARNVDFRLMDAESIDEPAASFDGVLCRWGLMLMADPAAALRESRRVLRPGGRIALAAWNGPERNPWASLPARELRERGLAEAPVPGEPGMFALADPDRIRALLAGAGFTEIDVDSLEFEQRHPSLDEWWTTTRGLSLGLTEALAGLPPPERDELRAAIEARLDGYRGAGGEVVLPASTLVAAGTA